ncbi:hypothetical protein [Pseudohongiella sp.]|uniref:Uncharacterized protein n=1 Tax=marine sediment metagenome TaxID=412755 RepID=A0A0F9XIP3_9ZZZZ|nr:hypothetical protein [Pseudohongiella sp.]HDZ08940.1 hypothetical protein [Pseudohongiella sp.]HEA63982.1 hypothetical protein [Pseudohongiella sp.]
MKTYQFIFCIGTLVLLSPALAQDRWDNQLALPHDLVKPTLRNYLVQDGACAVSVKETLVPGTLQVGASKIIYPYICVREDRVHHCPPPITRDELREPTHQYIGQVTATYRIVDGNLATLSDFANPQDSEETDCGTIIVDYLKSITLP